MLNRISGSLIIRVQFTVPTGYWTFWIDFIETIDLLIFAVENTIKRENFNVRRMNCVENWTVGGLAINWL
jgi:hypothetical protein